MYNQKSIVQETEIENSGWKYQIWYNGNDYFWRARSTTDYRTKEATRVYDLPGDANKVAQAWVRSQARKARG